MASNIGPTASFATTNMKPASGEQIDALWGQNISDNTGFLYGRPLRQAYPSILKQVAHVQSGGIRVVLGTHVMDEPFYRPVGHNSFVGTASATTFHFGPVEAVAYDNVGTVRWGIYGDLGTWLSSVSYSVPNVATYSRTDSFATTVDLTALVSAGSWAQLRYTGFATTTNPDTGGDGYMRWALNNIKVLTKWA